MADDPKISQRYRELPREEPPRHLDDAILAAARRAADARPAPLVAPAGRRRWYFPLAAAAIIVLAVAVTVQVERQQHDVEVAEAPAAPKREVFAPEPKPAASPERRAQKAAAPQADLQKVPAPAPAAPAEAMGLRESAQAPQAARARAEVSGVAGKLQAVSPEQWLQGIADLRRQGRHDEADKSLAEFRRAYPDYKIPEAMLEKVEKR